MESREVDSCLVVEAVGEVPVARFTRELILGGALADAVGEKLAAALEANKARLLLDFANVKSLSSTGLAKLISLNRKAESLGGRFALCNLRPEIREIMDVTRLSQLLCIYPAEQEALASF